MTDAEDPYVTAARLMRFTRTLSLGTFGPEGAWVAPLSFTVEPDFSLLIELANDSHHCLNLRINPAVAGAVFDPKRSPHHADSIQFTGTALPIPADQVPAALDRYYKLSFPDDAERIRWMRPAEDFFGRTPHRFFRITLRTAFKLDLESTEADRRISLDVKQLKNIHDSLLS